MKKVKQGLSGGSQHLTKGNQQRQAQGTQLHWARGGAPSTTLWGEWARQVAKGQGLRKTRADGVWEGEEAD